VEPPGVKYATAGGLHIAYQRFGTGPDVVVIPPLVSNVEIFWDHELYRRVLEHVGRYLTVLQFDKRGIGMSDRFERSPTLDERIEDITAVMDAEGLERASVMGLSEGGLMAQLFAVRHPERVDRLTLMNTFPADNDTDEVAAFVHDSDPPTNVADTVALLGRLVETWGQDPQFMVDHWMPSQADNASFVRWGGRLQRQSATPADIARQIQSLAGVDLAVTLEDIAAPTLVIAVAGDRVCRPADGRYLADRIPNATYVEFPGEDHFLWVMPNWREIVDSWIEHVIGAPPPSGSERRFGTVLFTDLVGSTEATMAAGDSQWREMLDSHDRICREIIDRHGGRIVKSTGDGLLATFPTPSLGVSASAILVSQLASIGLTVRAGLHAGELEFREDGDVAGAAVNLAARVEQSAEPGQILVSSTLRDLLLGGDLHFVDQGERPLKGFDDPWRLYELQV
jgi:class 3 adenylate cyclase/pimeloyl-ACP methyl ester carboxylesterase